MLRTIFCWIIIFSFIANLQAQKQLSLIVNGKSDYRIVIPADATQVEQQSANILREYIAKISGCTLPVVSSRPSATSPQLVVGRSSLVTPAELKSLGEDGILIKKANNSVVLTGGTRKGVLYSVYTFLEDYLGCKMYSADVTEIPKNTSITLPATISKKQVPTFSYRMTFFHDALNTTYNDFHRMNYFMESWGLWVHSFETLVPKDKYFKSNPEYFALVKGQRTADQLCVSNPAVLRVAVATLNTMMKSKPNDKFWSVSANDNNNFCECENCTRLNNQQGSHNGSVLLFVNNVAKNFPNKTIVALAYMYTEKPPTTLKPGPNVMVMLCTSDEERRVPLKQQTSTAFYRNFQKWSTLTSSIFIWDYLVQFTNAISPFPNYYSMQPNVQYFASRKVDMIFLQGIGDIPAEFSELRCYLAAKLMWNKDIDFKSAMNEFVNGYYGKTGGSYINSYIAALTANIAAKPMDLKSGRSPMNAVDSYLSANNIASYKSIFEKALNATKGTVYQNRIIKEYLSVLYAELEINKLMLAKESKRATPMSKTTDNLLDNFIRLSKQVNVTSLNEARLKVDDYANQYNQFLDTKK